MAIEQNSKVKLIRREDEAFAFRVVDADTGRELSEAEVKARLPQQPEAKAGALPHGARSKALTAAPLRICGEGDSWINLLHPISGFPKTFFNVLGDSFFTNNIGFPGHTFERVLNDKQYVQVLGSGRYRVFIFSGGGNDILGGGGLADLLKKKSDGNGSAKPSDYVKPSALASVLKKLDTGYRQVAREAKAAEKDILMLTHGYDYAIPRKNGKWLGTPLKQAGFAHDEALSPKIIAFLVDQLNAMLAKVAADIAHVRHVNVRGTVKTLWHDELHPTAAGAKLVAKLFEKEIGRLMIS
jgi:GDSL-like Lipase/Acylhydrolase family